MPLDEEGAKWSCEPCIRGHRSSKCQHFDRLMMKVPKAGRPLAKCPHPKGTCSCQKTYAFMVRIPKGSSCLCRPLYKVPASPEDEEQQAQPSMPPMSSPAPGKIQKSGRRQSHIHAAPENIAKALQAMPDEVKREDGTPNYLAGLPLHQPGLNDNDSPHRNGAYTTQPSHESTQTARPQNGGSCCSSKPQPQPQLQPVAQTSGGSCCSGKSSAQNASMAPQHFQVQQSTAKQPHWSHMSHMNMSMPQTSWQSSMPATPAPYMPSFGMQEPQPSGYYMNGFSSQVPTPQYSDLMNGLGISQSQSPMTPFAPAQSHYSHESTPASDPCHDCKCGDECQCLGCAAHPFNNTTRQHVQEMGVMMTFDDDEHTPDGLPKSYQTQSFPNITAPPPMNFFMQQAPSMDHAVNNNAFDPYSDPSSAMPSGYSSPLPGHQLNQQLMHQSEYYTLEYPVGIPSACSDVTGSCQCGNDCSCVGCLTHSGHNGVPLDTSIPEAPLVSNPDQHGLSLGPSPTSVGPQPSRVPAYESMPGPSLSPRRFETSMI